MGLRIACAVMSVSAAWAAAPPPLSIDKPVIAQSDGGTPLPPGFTHVPGEVLFLSFEVGSYQKGTDDKVRLAWSVDGFDPQGTRIMETVSNEIQAELAPQDKEWKPKVRLEVALPPLADSGTYKLEIKVRDLVAKTEASRKVTFEVRGHQVEASPTLTVRNFRFFRGEDDTEALAKPVYRPGDPVWARFDITGYKYGEKNAIDLTFGVAVLAGEKTLWSQPDAGEERSQSFYPKRYVPGAMSITLQKNIRGGEYAIQVTAKDAIGGQSYEGKFSFFVEP